MSIRGNCPSCGESRNDYENHYCQSKRSKQIQAKIEKIGSKMEALRKQIVEIQENCEHRIKAERRVVGYNGFGHDIVTSCVCEVCGKSWYHDGYCSGDH